MLVKCTIADSQDRKHQGHPILPLKWFQCCPKFKDSNTEQPIMAMLSKQRFQEDREDTHSYCGSKNVEQDGRSTAWNGCSSRGNSTPKLPTDEVEWLWLDLHQMLCVPTAAGFVFLKVVSVSDYGTQNNSKGHLLSCSVSLDVWNSTSLANSSP